MATRYITMTEAVEHEAALRLNLRVAPQPAVNGVVQAAALPSIAAAAVVGEQRVDRARAINCIEATFRLFEILRQFAPQVQNWQDPLSIAIFSWTDEMAVFVEQALHLSRHAVEETAQETLHGFANRIDRLFREILNDPFEHPKVLDNPVIDGQNIVWGEALLRKYLAFTQQPCEARPHLVARAILEWGKQFFPALINDVPSQTPLQESDIKVIKKNAKVLVKLQIARRERQEAEKARSAAEAMARGAHQSNFQALLQRSVHIENQLQAEGNARCERLNQRIVQLTGFFERSVADVRQELAVARADQAQTHVQVIRLQVYAASLERRNEALAAEIGALRQSIACAYQRMNDDDGSCSVM